MAQLGLSTIPFVFPKIEKNAIAFEDELPANGTEAQSMINFIYDGLELSPDAYLQKLKEISGSQPIQPDFYGSGGVTKLLEEKFAKLTGKEKAIYLPTGTMANQLALKLLNQHNTKVIVPENSHVYRDEADAAQSVHGKRLIPVGIGKPYYNLADMEEAIRYLDENEVFKSGLGTVLIESPVRRANGAFVPMETVREISKYCKEHHYKMHLDGARIHIASAFSGVSISEYASYFDTVYISLYKYLNAGGGAMLCGDAEIIDQVGHQIKIFGGTVYQSWFNTAMANHYLDGIDDRWKQVVGISKSMVADLNQIKGVTLTAIPNGSNIFLMKLSNDIDLKKLANYLYKEHQIMLGRATKEGIVKFAFNDSLLTRAYPQVIEAWKKGIEQARNS